MVEASFVREMDVTMTGATPNVCAVPPQPQQPQPSSPSNDNNVVVITNANVMNGACNQYAMNSLSNGVPIPAVAPINTVTGTTFEDTEMRHRFKVVKLVSSQPYTRGRWTCFDYNDENQNTINIPKHVPVNKIHPNGHAENSALNDPNCNAVMNNGSDQSEVAIDNKIEQAMDLVKSHLMFAVREEVDVLRERIKELEHDIQILKAHATPETLGLLSNRTANVAANNTE